MNSRGIAPRPGMQVQLFGGAGIAKKVYKVDRKGMVWFKWEDGRAYKGCTIEYFMDGNYDIIWSPPDAAERRRWRVAAGRLRAAQKLGNADPLYTRTHGMDALVEFVWRHPLLHQDISVFSNDVLETYARAAAIAESLARDGS